MIPLAPEGETNPPNPRRGKDYPLAPEGESNPLTPEGGKRGEYNRISHLSLVIGHYLTPNISATLTLLGGWRHSMVPVSASGASSWALVPTRR